MLSIEIKAQDLEDLWKTDVTKKKMRYIMKRASIEGENLLKDEAKKITVSGTLFRSVNSTATADRINIFATAKHAVQALETGRKPGAMPNPRALQRWADKRGIPVSGYALAKSIAMKGTRKYRRGGPKQVSKNFADNVNSKLVPKLSKLIASAITNENSNSH